MENKNMSSLKLLTRSKIESVIKPLKVKNNDALSLYQQAFVHKSVLKYSDEHGITKSYERLECLGDRVLDLAVVDYLYHKYPEDDEGEISRKKVRIVQGSTLSLLAKKCGIQGKILMTDHTSNLGGQQNNNLLEDVFESLIGAIFKDHGYEIAKEFVVSKIKQYISKSLIETDTNYKDQLNKYCSKVGTSPEYSILRHDESGFVVIVKIFEEIKGKGRGKKKKDAEQEAARIALKGLHF